MNRPLFGALTLLSAFCLTLLSAPFAAAQTASPALYSSGPRVGGPITGGTGTTGTTWSWNVPAGQYLALARITYGLASTRTDTGGGVSALRCRLHRPGEGFIDISQVSVGGISPTNAGGELTLMGKVSNLSAGVLSVTCDGVFANARSSQRVDNVRIELVQVGSFVNLTPAP
jgi:hypothetical protein